MNQDDIYNLLLLILLMSNERENDTELTNRSARGSLNELIIASMLISSCNNPSADAANALSGNSSCRCRNNNANNGNTTF